MNALEHTAARDALVEATRAFVGKDEKLASRVHRSVLVSPEGGRAATGLIGMNEAAATLGRSGQGVRRLMEEGLLPAVDIDGRGIPAELDRAAVAALADDAKNWLSMRDLAVALDVSRARTARIVGAGLLRPVHGGPSNGWATWSFDHVEVARFLERLNHSPHSGCADVGFNYVAEAFRRKQVEIEGVLERILDGQLLVTGSDDQAVGLKRLRFHRGSVRKACRLLEQKQGGPMKTQVAAERLGLKWEVVANLIRRGLIQATEKGIESSEVNRFERDYIVGSRLASALGMSPRSVATRLIISGIIPVVGPGVDGSRQNVFRRAEVRALTGIMEL